MICGANRRPSGSSPICWHSRSIRACKALRAEEEARLIKKLEAVSMADVEGILNETLDPNNMCAFVAGKTAGMDTRAIERLIKG